MTDLIPDISASRASRGTPETTRAASVPAEGFGDALHGAIGGSGEQAPDEGLGRQGENGGQTAAPAEETAPVVTAPRSEPSAISIAAQAAFARLTERGVWHRALGLDAATDGATDVSALGAPTESDSATSGGVTPAAPAVDTTQPAPATSPDATAQGAAPLDQALSSAASSAAQVAVVATANAAAGASASTGATHTGGAVTASPAGASAAAPVASGAASAPAQRETAAAPGPVGSPATNISSPQMGQAAPSAQAPAGTSAPDADTPAVTAPATGVASSPAVDGAEVADGPRPSQPSQPTLPPQAASGADRSAAGPAVTGAPAGVRPTDVPAPAMPATQPRVGGDAVMPATPASPASPATPAASASSTPATPAAPAASPAAAPPAVPGAAAPTVSAPAASPAANSGAPTAVPASGLPASAPATGQPGLQATPTPTPAATDFTAPGMPMPTGASSTAAQLADDGAPLATPAAQTPFAADVRQGAAGLIPAGDPAVDALAATVQDSATAVDEPAGPDLSGDAATGAARADADEAASRQTGQDADERGTDQQALQPQGMPREAPRADFVPFGAERGFTAAASMPVAATAAAPTGSAPAAAPLQAQLMQGLDPIIRRGDGTHQVELQLAPAHLGKVRITLEIRGNEISVMMHAADGTARDLLKENADTLRSQLSQMGLQPGSVDVDSGGHADGNDGWQQLAAEQAQARRAAERGDGTGFPGEAPSTTAASAPAADTPTTTSATDSADDLDVRL